MTENKFFNYEGGGLLQHVCKVITVTNKLLGLNLPNLYAIHFDDHKLFLTGVKITMNRRIPTLFIDGFTKGVEALRHIEKTLSKNIKIDLIITGFNQPDIDGYNFAKRIREIESPYEIKTPIVLLTMYTPNPLFSKALMENVFDKYYTKDMQSKELAHFIKSIYGLN